MPTKTGVSPADYYWVSEGMGANNRTVRSYLAALQLSLVPLPTSSLDYVSAPTPFRPLCHVSSTSSLNISEECNASVTQPNKEISISRREGLALEGMPLGFLLVVLSLSFCDPIRSYGRSCVL